jgi:hypothetical protein
MQSNREIKRKRQIYISEQSPRETEPNIERELGNLESDRRDTKKKEEK